MIHALAESGEELTACGKPLRVEYIYEPDEPERVVDFELTEDGEHVHDDPRMANCADCMEALGGKPV